MTDAQDEERFNEQITTREADVEAPRRAVVERGGTFESFHHKDYTLFWSGALLSNVGTWMQNYALAIVVYSFRKSSVDLGIVNFLSGIPVLFLALPGGALADRVDRRRLIIWAQAVMLVQAAALGLLYKTGHLSGRHALMSLAWVAGLGLVAGVMSALTFPAWQALLPNLVPRETLLNAIALNSAQFQTSRLIGPLVAAGLVLAGAGMGEIFYANAASYLFVIAALLAVRPRPESRAELVGSGRPAATAQSSSDTGPASRREGSWQTLTAGVRYARENRVVGVLILSTALVTVFGFPYMMLLPAIAHHALGLTHTAALNRAVAYIMAANGLGAVLGALVVAGLPKTIRREGIIPYSLLGLALALVAFGFSRSLLATMATSTLAGALLLATNSLANTSIQAEVPGALRGRVMALFIMAFMGIMPISSIAFGPLAQVIGPSQAILAGAVVVAAWALTLIMRPSLLRPAIRDAAAD